MKRRALLGAVGSAASVGTLAYTTRDPVETLEVRFWLSKQAARYDGVSERIREYLRRMLDLEYWSLDISTGGTVDVSIEDGARVTTQGEWPAAIAAGTVGQRDVSPVPDVNLLVTDGGMTEAPTGYGLPNVASVGGARHIAALEPFDELLSMEGVDVDRWIVPNETRIRTIQILAHEVGHTLGLKHGHGASFVYGDAIVATPMLSSYAWTSGYDADQTLCGTSYPDPSGRTRKLSLAFSTCARRELATYSGGFAPRRQS